LNLAIAPKWVFRIAKKSENPATMQQNKVVIFLATGTVKWFNDAKGYGFLRS